MCWKQCHRTVNTWKNDLFCEVQYKRIGHRTSCKELLYKVVHFLPFKDQDWQHNTSMLNSISPFFWKYSFEDLFPNKYFMQATDCHGNKLSTSHYINIWFCICESSFLLSDDHQGLDTADYASICRTSLSLPLSCPAPFSPVSMALTNQSCSIGWGRTWSLRTCSN